MDRTQRLLLAARFGSDTFCHRDHVHFSMTWDGAAGRTCTGTTPGARPALRDQSGERLIALLASAAFIPVKPVRVVDSQEGEQGCYLQQRRWSGDDRSTAVRVSGRKGILTSGCKRSPCASRRTPQCARLDHRVGFSWRIGSESGVAGDGGLFGRDRRSFRCPTPADLDRHGRRACPHRRGCPGLLREQHHGGREDAHRNLDSGTRDGGSHGRDPGEGAQTVDLKRTPGIPSVGLTGLSLTLNTKGSSAGTYG